MSETWKQVYRAEFEAFLKQHPSPLQRDHCAIGEPPLVTFNDFRNGRVWPESAVAKILMYDGSDYHGGKTPEYFVRAQEVSDE